jgi:uncharacterized RDD family membrane protein YckC
VAGSERSSCGVLRRLAAITYDSLLLFGVLFLATIIVMVIFKPAEIQASHLFFPVYLLFVCYLYFVWQWVHGRQTLGMKAWKIMLINADTGMVNWKTASLRFLLALVSLIPFAFGLLWIILDSENVTFYDRYSKTRLIKLG